MQDLGKSPDAGPEHFSEICKNLGLDAAAIEPDMTFEEPLAFSSAYVAIFGLSNGAAEFLSYSTDLEAFHQMLRGTHEDK
ncbi:MAG: hypothetical protein EA424_06850 [Planctomycetaceae bacterium]|nr:MAG: hypothetical protein EA424_06850 [Planctomycetaceae bacterium]